MLNKKFALVVQKQFVGAKVWLFKNKVFYKCPELPLPYNARPLHSYLKSSKSKDFLYFFTACFAQGAEVAEKKINFCALRDAAVNIAYFKHAWSPVTAQLEIIGCGLHLTCEGHFLNILCDFRLRQKPATSLGFYNQFLNCYTS